MKTRTRLLVAAGSLAAGIAIAWVGMWLAVGSALPPKTFLLDVNISKLTTKEAIKKIMTSKSNELNGKISLSIDGKEYSIPAKGSGVTLDLPTALAAVPERSWNPSALWSALFSSKQVQPVIKSDEATFKRAIRTVEREVNLAPRNADVVFDGVVPKLVNATDGKILKREEALQTIAKEWLRKEIITVKLEKRPARITDAQAAEMFGFAQSAVSAPVVVTINAGATGKSQSFSVSPEVIAQSLTFIPGKGGRLEPKWLKATFINEVGRNWSANIVEPVNASFTISAGVPRVQPSRDGLDVPEETLARAMLAALGNAGAQRQVTLTPEPVAAKITTEMAGGLGIKEVIGSFTTYFPYAEYRITNIHRAARWMDGVIIQPGEVFSYNKAVGERTEARGFVPGIMIDKGVFKKDWGGGVSQVATTTWNAAWFSGLELLQHKPHSFYISRYPAGRESTVAWPSVDVKFRNNSGKAIFVDTSFTNKSVTVTIYGTKFVDVETESGPRTKPVKFKVLENDSENCIFQEGVSGFTIDVWRILKRDGNEIKREKFRTRYQPEDRIICTNPKARWMNPPIDVQRSLAD